MCNVDEKDIAEHLRVLSCIKCELWHFLHVFSLFVVPFVMYIVIELVLLYLCR
jgi:hypothetical protein